jgi:hypothetical protein
MFAALLRGVDGLMGDNSVPLRVKVVGIEPVYTLSAAERKPPVPCCRSRCAGLRQDFDASWLERLGNGARAIAGAVVEDDDLVRLPRRSYRGPEGAATRRPGVERRNEDKPQACYNALLDQRWYVRPVIDAELLLLLGKEPDGHREDLECPKAI